MPWFSKGRRVRSTLPAIGALLVLGGIVGAISLDGSDDATNASGSRARAVDAPAGVAPSMGVPSAGGGRLMAVREGDQPEALVADPGGGAAPSAATAAGGGGIAAGVSPGPLPPVAASRVVKTATLELEVGEKQFDAVHDRAFREVSRAGGFVQSSNLRPTRASLTFRVPTDEFEATLTRLRDLGKVRDETVTGQDVTEEFVDLEARLRHWQAQEAAFLELLGKAENVAETVEVRRELSTIQQTIEQLQGRIRFLDDRTGFSTVTLEMFVPGAAPRPEDDPGPSLSRAWDQAWDAAVTVVGGTLIVLGALVPLALIGGLAALLLWTALRRRGESASGPASSPAG